MEKTDSLLLISHVKKIFRHLKKVLKDISIDVYKGDVVFKILGPSGSGKNHLASLRQFPGKG